jgi:hypothetical protein
MVVFYQKGPGAKWTGHEFYAWDSAAEQLWDIDPSGVPTGRPFDYSARALNTLLNMDALVRYDPTLGVEEGL